MVSRLLTQQSVPADGGRPLKALRDEQTDAAFRVQLAEILGWYVRAPRRGDIVQACHELLADSATKDPALRNELQKTMNRLTAYMR